MYFKIEAYDKMERLLQAQNEICEQLEIDKKELALRLGQCESVLAQERVDREVERREAKQKKEQQVQLIKELQVTFRCVRTIVRESIAKIRGDPPSVALEHRSAKKRMRVHDMPPPSGPIPAIDLDEILDADFLASLAASLAASLEGSSSGSSA